MHSNASIVYHNYSMFAMFIIIVHHRQCLVSIVLNSIPSCKYNCLLYASGLKLDQVNPLFLVKWVTFFQAMQITGSKTKPDQSIKNGICMHTLYQNVAKATHIL